MDKFRLIFGQIKVAIGVIHLPALPGTPMNILSTDQIIKKALEEAKIYKEAGIDALIIENMHDVPYVKDSVGHEISTLMAICGYLIKQETALPIGIQILAGANKAALSVAVAANLDFIRAEGFVYGHIADEGYIDAQAGKLLRFRKQLNAEHIAVFTDIKKKHSSHAVTSDVSLVQTAQAAEFFLSDGLIITGNHTGTAASITELKSLQGELSTPIMIGSGITLENLDTYLPLCDAMIIGSHFKEEGKWSNKLSYARIHRFMKAFKN